MEIGSRLHSGLHFGTCARIRPVKMDSWVSNHSAHDLSLWSLSAFTGAHPLWLLRRPTFPEGRGTGTPAAGTSPCRAGVACRRPGLGPGWAL